MSSLNEEKAYFLAILTVVLRQLEKMKLEPGTPAYDHTFTGLMLNVGKVLTEEAQTDRRSQN